MKKIKLDFSDLYHIQDIKCFDKFKNILDKMTGIYIWGFILEVLKKNQEYRNVQKINMKEDCKVDLQKGQYFIPYYVGIASGLDNKTFLFQRLIHHYKGFYNKGTKPSPYNKPKLEYILGKPPLSPLSSDPDFLKDYYSNINFGKLWEKNFPHDDIQKRYDYINKYDPCNKNKPSYTEQELPFCFIYAKNGDIQPANKSNAIFYKYLFKCNYKGLLEHIETFTKYSLEHNTTSKSGNPKKSCFSYKNTEKYEGINICQEKIKISLNSQKGTPNIFI